jgi:hypothetical protein
VSEFERLRLLAETVAENAGDLYGLNWRSEQISDDLGIFCRVHVGGSFNTKLRLACVNEQDAPVLQRLADYVAEVTPTRILALLEELDEARGE